MLSEVHVLPTLGVQCLLIVAASLLGGRLPDWVQLTHERMQVLLSFVGGLMLGIGVLHMLPHAFAQLGSVDDVAASMMAGLLAMFFMLRMFHFHEHEPAQPPYSQIGSQPHPLSSAVECSSPGEHHHAEEAHEPHNLSWAGVAAGLSMHSLIDGMAVSAAVCADAAHGTAGMWLGMGTFLAVLLHKPLDAVSITSLMTVGRWTPQARLAVNVAFALICPLGAALFLVGVQRFSGVQSLLVGSALAFSAGVFVCISMGDLLPEIEFHEHDRVKLSACLLAGVVAAWLIGFAEPAGLHPRNAPPPADHGQMPEEATPRSSAIAPHSAAPA